MFGVQPWTLGVERWTLGVLLHLKLEDKDMRAVQLAKLGKPLIDAEVPFPDIGPSDVMVRVAACGICHSDAHYRAGIS